MMIILYIKTTIINPAQAVDWIIAAFVDNMTRFSNGSHAPSQTMFNAVSLFAFCRLVPLILIAASASEISKKCERLEDALTYTQEEAPRDLSSVVCFG